MPSWYVISLLLDKQTDGKQDGCGQVDDHVQPHERDQVRDVVGIFGDTRDDAESQDGSQQREQTEWGQYFQDHTDDD